MTDPDGNRIRWGEGPATARANSRHPARRSPAPPARRRPIRRLADGPRGRPGSSAVPDREDGRTSRVQLLRLLVLRAGVAGRSAKEAGRAAGVRARAAQLSGEKAWMARRLGWPGMTWPGSATWKADRGAGQATRRPLPRGLRQQLRLVVRQLDFVEGK